MKTDVTSIKSVAIDLLDALLGGGKGTASSRETAMKTGPTSITFLARIAHARGMHTGGFLVIFYLAGHSAIFEALRFV
jgi:hypothetical protein